MRLSLLASRGRCKLQRRKILEERQFDAELYVCLQPKLCSITPGIFGNIEVIKSSCDYRKRKVYRRTVESLNGYIVIRYLSGSLSTED